MKDDYLNIGFILLAGLLAYILPFELLLFSYAFLGPAHYLTQISWMHKRKYFLEERWEIAPLILLTILMVIFPQYYQDLIAITLTTAMVLVFVKRLWLRLVLITLFSGLIILYQYLNGPNIFLFFLPTLVHVFLFTAIFIIHGALKRNSKPAYASAVLLFGVAISFFIFSKIPSNYLASELSEGNMRFFEEDIRELIRFFGLGSSWEYIMASARFVAFAYTYHYLNWFSKTETIGWHKIPRQTALIIGGLYLLFVGLYLYDFVTGLKALIFLSLLHVILELPLNSITVKSLLQRAKS